MYKFLWMLLQLPKRIRSKFGNLSSAFCLSETVTVSIRNSLIGSGNCVGFFEIFFQVVFYGSSHHSINFGTITDPNCRISSAFNCSGSLGNYQDLRSFVSMYRYPKSGILVIGISEYGVASS